MAGERALPGLGLNGFWTLGSNGYKDQLDANLRTLSALVQASAIGFVPFLPGSPANGDIYILDDGAEINQIGVRDNGAWVMFTPAAGWLVWSEDDDAHFVFNGTTWIEFLPSLAGYQVTTEKGVADGYASLNGSGQVPASQLPGGGSVEEYANLAAFPGSGSVGTIYIALDTDTSYIWDDDDSIYVAQTSTGTLPSNVGFKSPCRLVATSNVDIATGGVVTIDGKVTATGYRVLLTGQTAPAENGIYVAGAGAWTRAADANTVSEVRGSLVTVWQGTAYGSSLWFTTFKQGHTLGTTAMNWFQVATADNVVDLIDTILGSTAWQGGGGGGGGAVDFTDLADVPAAYTGEGLKAVRVKAAEDGLEFYDPPAAPASFSVDTKTANYSTVSADFAGNKLIRMNLAGANTFTVDPSMANGEPLAVTQTGAGQTTIVAGSGVTLASAGGALKLRVQHSTCSIMKIATDSYLVVGDLEA